MTIRFTLNSNSWTIWYYFFSRFWCPQFFLWHQVFIISPIFHKWQRSTTNKKSRKTSNSWYYSYNSQTGTLYSLGWDFLTSPKSLDHIRRRFATTIVMLHEPFVSVVSIQYGHQVWSADIFNLYHKTTGPFSTKFALQGPLDLMDSSQYYAWFWLPRFLIGWKFSNFPPNPQV